MRDIALVSAYRRTVVDVHVASVLPSGWCHNGNDDNDKNNCRDSNEEQINSGEHHTPMQVQGMACTAMSCPVFACMDRCLRGCR
ncbi:hypothetical protein VTH06DRAFT_4305 [Thermothelomyces fergusii]